MGLRDYEADTGVITAMDLSCQVGLRLITRKSHLHSLHISTVNRPQAV